MNSSLKGKKILLGITGSIAAYKTPVLVREFVKQGAEVRIVITESALRFVTELALHNVSKNSVITDMFDESLQENGSWHIHLAQWCDCFVIAPCSANTLAKIAHGFADNALTALVLALPKGKPLSLFPAMDTDMWLHKATQKNCKEIIMNGGTIFQPDSGELASGMIGEGRLPEPSDIVVKVANELLKRETDRKLLKGKRVLITTGPTYERFDAVRFIGNYSSGKMGFAIAEQAAISGAEVTLIAGPVHINTNAGINRIDVHSAEEMFEQVRKNFAQYDIAIFSAAVADYAPKNPSEQKMKKEDTGEELTITLKKNPDILTWAGNSKREHQRVIGFALETNNEIEEGRAKMKRKNCDLMVINKANEPDSGFGGDNNTIIIMNNTGEYKQYPTLSKKECAEEIIKKTVQLF